MRPKPRLVIDGRKLGDGGIGVYIENLLDGLLALRNCGEIDLDISLIAPPNRKKGSAAAHLAESAESRWEDAVDIIPDDTGKYSVNEFFRFASKHRTLLRSATLFHSPHYTLPFFLDVPAVVTIHDVIHVTHPASPLHKYIGRTLIRSAIDRAARVITVSEHSREEIERCFTPDPSRIVVVRNALRPGVSRMEGASLESVLESFDLSTPYAVFVGSARTHKGFRDLLEAFSRSAPQEMRLVCVGSDFGSAQQTVSRYGLKGRVKFLSGVSTEELSGILSGATALLITSREEGFCFPALEAMAVGVPVVSTPLPSVIEICGPAAWYAGGFGAAMYSQVLNRFFEHSEAVSRVVRLGLLRSASFDLIRFARATIGVYESALTGHTGKSLPLGLLQRPDEREPVTTGLFAFARSR